MEYKISSATRDPKLKIFTKCYLDVLCESLYSLCIFDNPRVVAYDIICKCCTESNSIEEISMRLSTLCILLNKNHFTGRYANYLVSILKNSTDPTCICNTNIVELFPEMFDNPDIEGDMKTLAINILRLKCEIFNYYVMSGDEDPWKCIMIADKNVTHNGTEYHFMYEDDAIVVKRDNGCENCCRMMELLIEVARCNDMCLDPLCDYDRPLHKSIKDMLTKVFCVEVNMLKLDLTRVSQKYGY